MKTEAADRQKNKKAIGPKILFLAFLAGIVVALSAATGLYYAFAPRPTLSSDLVFKKGFTWYPFKLNFFVGDTVWFQKRRDTGLAEPKSQPKYRLKIKKGLSGSWQPVRTFTDKVPGFKFNDEGIYSILLEENAGPETNKVWMGQFYAAPLDYLKNRCNLLRRVVSRRYHIHGVTNAESPYRAIAQESLAALLLLYLQYKKLNFQQSVDLVSKFAGPGLEVQRLDTSDQDGNRTIVIRTPELGMFKMDLSGMHLDFHQYSEQYLLKDFPGLRTVFQKTANENVFVAIAAALTYSLHTHFVYSMLPWEDIMLGYPEVAKRFGHCGTYQWSLWKLLSALGYRNRVVSATYNKGAQHVFNEISLKENENEQVYTLDATCSVYFRGTISDLRKAEKPVFLPAVTILADYIWNADFASSITPDNLIKTYSGEWQSNL